VLMVAGDFGFPKRYVARKLESGSSIRNLEKDSSFSKNSYNKSVKLLEHILKGELSDMDLKLPYTVVIGRAQGNSSIDGDSATLSQLTAVISAISELPIRQNIAVTGSSDSFGNAMPIGGANKKIEGFYEVCKRASKDFTDKGEEGFYGVAMPKSNIENLMLDEDVVSAFSDGHFKVYAVSDFKELCDIMFGKSWDDIKEVLKEKFKKDDKKEKKDKPAKE